MMNNTFILDEFKNPVTIHSKDDFSKMREAGELASMVLDYVTPFVKEGVTTLKLDMLCHDFIISKERKFYHFNNVYGTESPEYIIANANKKIDETKFTCSKL